MFKVKLKSWGATIIFFITVCSPIVSNATVVDFSGVNVYLDSNSGYRYVAAATKEIASEPYGKLKLTKITNVHTGNSLSYAYAKSGNGSGTNFGKIATVGKNTWTDIYIPISLRTNGAIVSLYMTSYYPDIDCYVSGYWNPR